MSYLLGPPYSTVKTVYCLEKSRNFPKLAIGNERKL
jgi:hypothetical protein